VQPTRRKVTLGMMNTISIDNLIAQLFEIKKNFGVYVRVGKNLICQSAVRVSTGMHAAKKQLGKIAKIHVTEIAVTAFVVVLAGYILIPTTVDADVYTGPSYHDSDTVSLIVASMQNETKSFGALPEAKEAEARELYTVPVTAYSSTVDQCDDSPFITATGEHVYDGGIAANFLPFGTKVRIPELYGDKVFTVNDRMNSRYYYRADIWMETRQEAINFGLQTVTLEVF
jgi:3D (Asp-Asp-Asp) domain-containing protein